jgi:RimJ/RimL family protein N-acetyltransferase
MPETDVRIEPWSEDDLPLLRLLLGDAAMMVYLGGPESPEKIAERQSRYEQQGSRQYRIDAEGEGAGWVGYWEREWRGDDVYEVGWSVLPAFQGRGLAGRATAQLIEVARAEGDRRFMLAFPSVDNGPSNAICRKLGFTLLGEFGYEWPPDSGRTMLCNDWRLELFA